MTLAPKKPRRGPKRKGEVDQISWFSSVRNANAPLSPNTDDLEDEGEMLWGRHSGTLSHSVAVSVSRSRPTSRTPSRDRDAGRSIRSISAVQIHADRQGRRRSRSDSPMQASFITDASARTQAQGPQDLAEEYVLVIAKLY